jgi:hypothetical protein
MRYLTVSLILLFASFASGQNVGNRNIEVRIFEGVTGDTIASITSSDSVEVQFYSTSAPWKLLTSTVGDTALITADDKAAGNTVVFNLAAETYWTQAPNMRFRIYSTGVDTCTSRWIDTAYLNGALTLFIKAEISGTNVDYGNSVITGN